MCVKVLSRGFDLAGSASRSYPYLVSGNAHLFKFVGYVGMYTCVNTTLLFLIFKISQLD